MGTILHKEVLENINNNSGGLNPAEMTELSRLLGLQEQGHDLEGDDFVRLNELKEKQKLSRIMISPETASQIENQVDATRIDHTNTQTGVDETEPKAS